MEPLATPYRVELAGAHQVDQIWKLVTDGLEHACRKTGGDMTADYLWSECRSGKAFLVIVTDAEKIAGASVWRFEAWTSGRKLRCLALYGRRAAEWLAPHELIIRDIAKAGGATALVTEGRAGWQRLYPKARVVRQLYEVEL